MAIVQKIMHRLTLLGTRICPSKKLKRRVVWTNKLALLLSVMLFSVGTVSFAVLGVTGKMVVLCLSLLLLIIILISVLLLNKCGYFTHSRVLLIIIVMIGPTILSLIQDAYDTSIILVLPVVLACTLFDLKSMKVCIPLYIASGTCYTVSRWRNETSQVQVLDGLIGLVVMLVIGFLFFLLSDEQRLDREEELSRMVTELQTEVEARRVVESSLRKANQVKQEFLATMSHEIRTPMNGVVASADLLGSTYLNAEQQDLCDTIKSSALALITIINDILDFTKIDAGKMTIESVPFNVRDTTEQVLDYLAATADEKGVELVCDVAGPLLSHGVVISDPGRFRQLLLNLLGNAVKFTQNGYVRIHAYISTPDPTPATEAALARRSSFLRCTPPATHKPSAISGPPLRPWVLHVEVEDNGEGIPSSRLDGLFQAFTQADSSISRRHGGTGLGLAICSKLVQLMGGHIGVRSELGKGSTFTFSLLVDAVSPPVNSTGTATGGPVNTPPDATTAKEPGRVGERAGHVTEATSAAGGGGGGSLHPPTLPGQTPLTLPGDLLSSDPLSSGAVAVELRSERSSPLSRPRRRSSSRLLPGGNGSRVSPTAGLDRLEQRLRRRSWETGEVEEGEGGGGEEGGSQLPHLSQQMQQQQQEQQQQQQGGLVVVVWEPVSQSCDALCNLLRHHTRHLQQQQQQQKEQEQPPPPQQQQQRRLVVCPVPQPADLSAVVRVMEEQGEGVENGEDRGGGKSDESQGRREGTVGVVLVCDYRPLLRLLPAAPCNVATTAISASSSSSSPTAAAAATTSCVDAPTERTQEHQHRQEQQQRPQQQQPQQQHQQQQQQQEQQQRQQIRRLTTVLRRPDVGLVLLGPRSHRTRVEVDAAAAAAAGGGEITGSISSSSGSTRSISNGDSVSSKEGGGGGRLPTRWEYVNKPVHRSALLLALQDLTRTRGGGGEAGGGEKDLKNDDSSSSYSRSSSSSSISSSSSNSGGGDTGVKGGTASVVANQQQRQDASTRGRLRSRVLVVEDNKVNQKVMGKMLTRLGVEFDIVGNGQLAVEAFRSHGDSPPPPQGKDQEQQQQQPEEDKVSFGGGYGMVLMDCHMPVMDGFEATAAIRELEVAAAAAVAAESAAPVAGAESAAESTAGSSSSTTSGGGAEKQQQARVPIIAVTASALEEELQRCRDVGMDGVLPKPVRLAGIQELLQSYGVCN